MKDISDREAREELITRHGRMATPTLVIGDRVFVGFRDNRQEIEDVLNSSSGGK